MGYRRKGTTKGALRVTAVLLVFAAVVFLSEHEDLPGTAFNWNLLFHLVRAAAALGTCGLVLLIGWRAMHGEFPISFGPVEYAQKQADAAAGVTSNLEERLRLLEALNDIRDPADIRSTTYGPR